MRTEKLQQTFDLDVHWVYFPLHPDTPAEGMSLEDLFSGRGMDIEAMQARMRDVMAAEGLEYGVRTHTYNSRLAQELAACADETMSDSKPMHDALYRAYFVDAKNVGDIEVLRELGTAAGVSPESLAAALDDRAWQAAVDDDWRQAHSYGVTGVPTFVAGGRGAVGAQPYDTLERLVTEAGAQRRVPA